MGDKVVLLRDLYNEFKISLYEWTYISFSQILKFSTCRINFFIIFTKIIINV